MDNISQVDYVLRVETSDEKHVLIEKMVKDMFQDLVQKSNLSEFDVEYYKRWYENNKPLWSYYETKNNM